MEISRHDVSADSSHNVNIRQRQTCGFMLRIFLFVQFHECQTNGATARKLTLVKDTQDTPDCQMSK